MLINIKANRKRSKLKNWKKEWIENILFYSDSWQMASGE